MKFLDKLNSWFWSSSVGESIEDTSTSMETWAKAQLALLATIVVGIVILIFKRR